MSPNPKSFEQTDLQYSCRLNMIYNYHSRNTEYSVSW